MARASVHVEPHDVVGIARHYIRDLVYGANDGIVTTFAVVAGVAGGELSHRVVLIVGAANLVADGLSMAVGNFASIRANESARAMDDLPEEESNPWRHAGATFLAFVAAGSVPLVPYIVPTGGADAFRWSIAATLASLFAVGALRATVTIERWWAAGLEMLTLGALVAAAAYAAGATIAALVA
ncbi:MAG TPA: VIT1/CCC1 transporter family protein [Vicinamibacterales bacterium]|nr:VIT1/CCC1 transporter family protein [Vicinamibacterales bacterium]